MRTIYRLKLPKSTKSRILILFDVGDDLNSLFDEVSATLTESSATDLQGKIVYFPKGDYLSFVASVKDFQDRGAIAVLYGSSARM